jgi:hypothetical protein
MFFVHRDELGVVCHARHDWCEGTPKPADRGA